jgi:internalin A
LGIITTMQKSARVDDDLLCSMNTAGDPRVELSPLSPCLLIWVLLCATLALISCRRPEATEQPPTIPQTVAERPKLAPRHTVTIRFNSGEVYRAFLRRGEIVEVPITPERPVPFAFPPRASLIYESGNIEVEVAGDMIRVNDRVKGLILHKRSDLSSLIADYRGQISSLTLIGTRHDTKALRKAIKALASEELVVSLCPYGTFDLSLLQSVREKVVAVATQHGCPAKSVLAQLQDFPNLRYVSVDDTDIDDSSFASLGKAGGLRELSMSNAKGPVDEELRHLSKLDQLEELYLDESLRAEGVENLSRIESLRDVHVGLSGQSLSPDDLIPLTGLDILESLDIFGGATDDTLEAISSMSGLRSLSIGSMSRLTEKGLAKLTALRHLELLDVDWDQAKGDPTLRFGPGCPLQSIVLRNARSAKALFDSLSECRELTEISLEGSFLPVKSLAAAAKLPRLKLLALHQTVFEEGIVESLADLEHLEYLYVSESRLAQKGKRPLELRAKKLRELHLDEVDWLAPGGLELGGQDLEELSLKGTCVNEETLKAISDLDRLRVLDLSESCLTDETIEYLTSSSVEHLNLAKNKITRAARTLSAAQSLRSLDLSQTQVGDDTLVHLSAAQSLRSLDLRDTKVGDATLTHLSKHKELTQLDLGGTNVGDVGLANLEQLKSLGRLYLDGTKVTDDGLAHLQKLEQLSTLDLSSCPITREGLAHLEGLRSLRVLLLEKTDIKDSPSCFQKMTSLLVLSVAHTEVGPADVSVICNLDSLVYLGLNGDTISFEAFSEACHDNEQAWPWLELYPPSRRR